MKKLGSKKFSKTVEGHQDCGICHPATKAGRLMDNQRAFLHEIVSEETPDELADQGLFEDEDI